MCRGFGVRDPGIPNIVRVDVACIVPEEWGEVGDQNLGASGREDKADGEKSVVRVMFLVVGGGVGAGVAEASVDGSGFG